MKWLKYCVLASLAPLAACQDVEKPTTMLTQQQWKKVEKHLLKTAPDPKYKVGAVFDGKIELIGYDIDGDFTPGKPATFKFYWKSLEVVDKNWKVFVHFESTKKKKRKNFDHVPVGGLYETTRWRPGQIIEDIYTETLPGDFPVGKAKPLVGFWRGKDRLPVTSGPTTKDNRAIGPEIDVVAGGKGSSEEAPSAPAKGALKPTLSVFEVADAAITVDGKLDEKQWASSPKAELSAFADGEFSTDARVFYTKDALYIGATLQDSEIWGDFTERDSDTWTQEVFEVFLDVDGDNADYLELQVTPRNVVFDANFKKRLGRGEGSRTDQINAARAWNMEGLETAVAVDGTLNAPGEDKAWTIEMKIPFATTPGLSAPPKPGDTWALNLYRFDRPGKKGARAYAWSTGPRGDFHEVSKFGVLTFKGPRGGGIKSLPATKKIQVDPNAIRRVQGIRSKQLEKMKRVVPKQ
jgi:hypothetical protein